MDAKVMALILEGFVKSHFAVSAAFPRKPFIVFFFMFFLYMFVPRSIISSSVAALKADVAFFVK